MVCMSEQDINFVFDGSCYFTVGEVASRLRVHPVTVHRWVKRGLLEAVRLPGGFRVSVSSLERFEAQNRAST